MSPPDPPKAKSNSFTPQMSSVDVQPAAITSLEDVFVRLVSPFLALKDVLILRKANRRLYFERRFKLREVCYEPFSFLPEPLLMHYLVPLSVRAVAPSSMANLNFSHCSSITDNFVKHLVSPEGPLPPAIVPREGSEPEAPVLEANLLHSPLLPNVAPCSAPSMTLLTALNFDFCSNLTDSTLQCLLKSSMPQLARLSVHAVRSTRFTGSPFQSSLSRERWPQFREFNCSFTHVDMCNIRHVAHHILDTAKLHDTKPRLGIIGSFATNEIIKTLGLSEHQKNFRDAIFTNDEGLVEVAVRSFVTAWSYKMECTEFMKRMYQMVRSRGAAVLVNAPISMEILEEKRRKQEAEEKIIQQSKGKEIGRIPSRTSLTSCSKTSDAPIKPSLSRDNDLPPIRESSEADLRQEQVTRLTFPLLMAIRMGNRRMLQILTDNGAKITIYDYDGASPLYLAARYACQVMDSTDYEDDVFGSSDDEGDEIKKRARIVKCLIEKGALVNSREHNAKKWVINTAAKYNNKALLSLLLANGAKVNILPPSLHGAVPASKPPLVVACECDKLNVECIELLLEAKADPFWRSTNEKASMNPAVLAFKHDPSTLPLFLKYVRTTSSVNGKGDVALTLPSHTAWCLGEILVVAIMNNDSSSLRLLLSRWPQLLRREHPMWSFSAIQAAKCGKTVALQVLIETCKKFSMDNVINNKSAQGKTPLLTACSECQYDAVTYLLEQGADPNIADSEGNVALHFAAEEDNEKYGQVLLNFGADINRKNNAGWTPLMLAICQRQESFCFSMLASDSVDLNVRNSNGRTLLMLAVFFGLTAVGTELVERGANVLYEDVNKDTAETILREKIKALSSKSGLKTSIVNKISQIKNLGAKRQAQKSPRENGKPSQPITELSAAIEGGNEDATMRDIAERKRKAAVKLLRLIRQRSTEQRKQRGQLDMPSSFSSSDDSTLRESPAVASFEE